MNILKQAHKLTKEIKGEYPSVDYMAQLGICISYLSENKGEVEMVELKGTEKQIKWAEDIRKDLLERMEEYKGDVISKKVSKATMVRDFKEVVLKSNLALKCVREYREELVKLIENGIEKLKQETSAKRFIDINQSGKCSGMYFEDILKELI